MAQHVDRQQLRHLWEHALAEDGFEHDVTSLLMVEERAAGRAGIVSREEGVFAGSVIFDLLGEAYAPRLTVTPGVRDGDGVVPGTAIASLAGTVRLLLGIERTLLNFLQRLCGVASLTRQYVDAVAGTPARIYDTRKTVPAWRELDKYAVRCGGGHNHRMGLHDAVLVKDNHLAPIAAGQLARTVREVLDRTATLNPPPHFVEFEVDTFDQLQELLKVRGIDVILLDNFRVDQLRKAVARRNGLGLAGKVELEASGGVNLETVRAIAETGVERISVGAITHSAPALDLAMELETQA